MDDPVAQSELPVLESERLRMGIEPFPQKAIQCINTKNWFSEWGEDLNIVNFKTAALEQPFYGAQDCF